MKIISNCLFIVGFFISFILVGVSIDPVSAQDISYWSPQQRIPGYDKETWPPILLADTYGTVHAFSYQWLNKNEGSHVRGIVYNRWIQGQGWTSPTDILLSPEKNDARLLYAHLDQTGIVHIIFWGGDNTGANIYYSNAPISEAGTAVAWLSPILVAENAQDPENGVIYIDDQNNLVVLFAGISQGNGIYSTNSKDNGITWSKPFLLYNSHGNNLISEFQIFRGISGSIQAIWNESNLSGQGRGIYYSGKRIGDLNWNNPLEIANANSGYGTHTPAIIEYHNVVYAFYNLDGFIWQRSCIDGQTWTYPWQLFPHHVGVNGALSLVVDSNDDLHIFFGQRITGAPDIHGMWQSVYNGVYWSEPNAITSGPQVSDHIADKAFDPYQARAIVSRGNLLLVTWRSDPGLMGNGVWYSYMVINEPELDLVGAEKLLPTSTPYPYPTNTPLSPQTTPIPSSVLLEGNPEQKMNSSPNNNLSTIMLFATVPVIILISVFFIFALLTHHKHP